MTDTEPIVVEATYAADRSAVWAAITDVELMPQWYFAQIAAFRPEVGFETQFTVHSLGKDWVHLWRVTDVVHEQTIAYTFNYAGYDGDASVQWELFDVTGGTRLRLTHTGLETYPRNEPAFDREMGVAGWAYFLRERLKRFLEESPSAEAVVREFWRLMGTNDFHAVKAVLAEELIVEWPQSKERIRGPERFARMNAEYPASGRWQFTINRLVACGEDVVTQVSLTDGTQAAEPVSFFTVRAGKVVRLVEYWPEPFAPAENRQHLVERMG